MKTNTLSALLTVALAMLASSCGTAGYYTSGIYSDGIYYRSSPETRAQIIADNSAKAQTNQTDLEEDFVASDDSGNLWLVSNNREGYFASKLHRFDSPTYTFPFWVGVTGAIVYDAFGRPYYWDRWRYPYYSSWWWDDYHYWHSPWHPYYGYGYHHPYHYYHPTHHGTPYPDRAGRNVVYTHRSSDGAYRTSARSSVISSSGRNRSSSANSTSYYGNRSNRISSSAVSRSSKARSSSSGRSRSSYSSSSASRSSAGSLNGSSSSYNGSSSSRSTGSSSSGSSSSGGGRRR